MTTQSESVKMAARRSAIVQSDIFDPESEVEEGEAQQEEQEEVLRMQQEVSEWCSCGNCATMPTEQENVCCREVPQVLRRMQQVDDHMTCMLDHPGLEPVCLNPYSLQREFNYYRANYGRLQIRGIEKRFRYVGYRSFGWCWGFLGRRVRVVVPACVVLRIRREFPDPEGRYVGFKLPALD